MIDALLLVAGLALLLKGADFLVEGASEVAERLGISQLVIGLTVVAFGTSMPEVVVTLLSGVQGHPDLAIGNILGSNIANILLVLGIAAIIRPLPVNDSTVVSEIPFSLTAALLVGFLANAALFSGQAELSISHSDGAILLFFFFLFGIYIYNITRSHIPTSERRAAGKPMLIPIVKLVGGLTALWLGGHWVVESAIEIARHIGISDSLIGLTIVAIGTSLPELMASAVAAYRNQPDIAVGNVVGSNIFNLLWVLGIASLVTELPFEVVSNADLVMVIVASTLLLLALVTSRATCVLRVHGFIFVSTYGAYLYYLIQRG
jgi:cation:H+ antiporter